VVNNSKWKEKEITMQYSKAKGAMPYKNATKKKVEDKKKKKKPMKKRMK
jgi:hypothetical protein